MDEKLTIIAESKYSSEAERIGKLTGGEVAYDVPAPEDSLCLVLDDSGLSLVRGSLKMTGDYEKLIPRLKPNNLNGEMICRAAKLKNSDNPHPLLLDATAGMGEDSLLLAAFGFEIQLYEYDPVISSLLENTVARGALSEDERLRDAVSRMHVHCGDSIEAMERQEYHPDVILLDPMFPERQKSGLVKKKFQLLHCLELPCSDDNGKRMLDAAISCGPKKIVIKRPAKGEYLAGRKPDYSLDGKAIRYDVITAKD